MTVALWQLTLERQQGQADNGNNNLLFGGRHNSGAAKGGARKAVWSL